MTVLTCFKIWYWISLCDSNLSISLSLSFGLWIPLVRGQPHGFSFSIRHDSLCPPPWATSPPCCTWLRRSTSTSLSMNVCLDDSFDTVIFFSPLYMPIPSQPGLAYLVRDPCYSNDATDVINSFRVLRGKYVTVTCLGLKATAEM